MAVKTAIVVAAGKGTRMGTEQPKQYLSLGGKPVLYYALRAFQDSLADRIILVVPEGHEDYCDRQFRKVFGFTKLTDIIAGGKERMESVYRALLCAAGSDYVFIHDGVRPFLTQELIGSLYEKVKIEKACIAAVPMKDTVKQLGADGKIAYTQERSMLMAAQTPQVFEYQLLLRAYRQIMKEHTGKAIYTDDAEVVEKALKYSVSVVEGSYRNLKITTPEDISLAELYLGEILKEASKRK